MIDFKIDLRGVPALVNKLNWVDNAIEREKQKILRDIGLLVQRDARRNAPFLNGDLERSIVFRTHRNDVEVLVPGNSAAGRYAERIHDFKGRTWNKRGVKTIAKGARADEKYISRAIDDDRVKINAMLDKLFRILRTI